MSAVSGVHNRELCAAKSSRPSDRTGRNVKQSRLALRLATETWGDWIGYSEGDLTITANWHHKAVDGSTISTLPYYFNWVGAAGVKQDTGTGITSQLPPRIVATEQ
jgi:hypothetical protein